jgi:TfoX/Sxy family transcriptional regulator of competence genes
MAYDEHLAERVRELLGPVSGISEKRMFGGLAFLVDGRMAVAVSGQGGLMVRVNPAEVEKLLTRAHVAPMVMRGRELRGWIRVGADGVKTKKQLQTWIDRGAAEARSQPAK